MGVIGAVAANTFRQTVRQRLFYNVILFGVGLVLLGMVIGNITFGYPDRVVRSIGLSGVDIAVSLIALLIGTTLIHQEIDKKTLFVVLTRPLHRWQYVTGRYLGLCVTLALTLALLSVIFFLVLLSVRGEILIQDVVALAMSLPQAMVLGGFAVALSAFSTPTLSAGIGIGFWIATATSDDLVRLTAKADPLTKGIAQAFYYVLPSLARFNFRESSVYQLPVHASHVLSAVAYGLIYAMFMVVLASIILARRDMT